MFKAFDTDRIHFVEGDTDSSYWAISGDPNEGCHQGFKHVIKDQKFYDENVYKWFPNDTIADQFLRKADEKKLLGVSVEKEGTEMYAVAPKCYYIETAKGSTSKVKGVSNSNGFLKNDYKKVLNDNEVIKGRNMGFYMKKVDGEFEMVKLEVFKDAITPTHDKMYCFANNSCAPLIKGFTDKDYEIA